MNEDQYFNDPEFKELLSSYEQSQQTGEHLFIDAEDLADIADYYYQSERYDEAALAIQRAAELDPNALAVLNYQIHEALAADDITTAEQLLSRIMERESPEYIYNRAEILIAQNRVDEADAFLRQCLNDVEPDELQDYVLDVANIYTDYSLNDKALEWMMRAKPDNTDDFKELMARTLFGLGKYEDSERLFNELIDRDPFQKRYWNALASAQYMNEDFSASVTSSEYAIAIDPGDPDAVISKANALFRLDNYEEALSYYERYSRLVPDDEFGLLHQGSCLLNLGRYEESAARLHAALLTAPDDSEYRVEILQELAFANSEMHRPDEAIRYLDLTDELDCDHTDMLVIRGHILLANDRLNEAEQMFKLAMQESGDSPHVMMRILVSLYDNKYTEASYAMFRKFFTIVDEDWNEGYAYMALCCWDTKRYDEFLSYLDKACRKNPHEARLVLSSLFPAELPVSRYCEYMTEKLKQ